MPKRKPKRKRDPYMSLDRQHDRNMISFLSRLQAYTIDELAAECKRTGLTPCEYLVMIFKEYMEKKDPTS